MYSEFPVPERFRPVIKDLVHELVVSNYSGLETDGRAGLFSAERLHEVVTDYSPCTFIDLPDEVWEQADAYYIERRGYWAVDVPLWTVEEGRSDLTLQVTIHETDDGFNIAIENLHVL